MLQFHKPILADDRQTLLQYERGLFELVSPSAKEVGVVCRRNVPPDLVRAPNEQAAKERGCWRVEKVAEA